MRLALALLVASLAGACATVERATGIQKGAELSYGEVQTVQAGLTAAQVADAFGEPGSVERGPDGRVRRMEYAVVDATGSRGRLVLKFDEREVLFAKEDRGAVAKP